MGSSKWPVMAGCALGFGLAVQFWPGGYDGLEFYMKAPMPNTTAPAWVYLLTWPLSWLGWPLSWQVLTAVTVLIVALVAMRSGARYWWAPLISLPLLWNVWLAQIEVLPVAGALLGMLVSRRKLHPAWLGVAWLLLAVKPQVGAGLALLFAWWIWRERGLRSLWPACCIVVAVVAVTILLWPAWIGNWLSVMRAFRATWWSASVWPYGLLAWPLALMPGKISQERRMRMVAAATLLGSPYFALYHATTLVALAASPLLAVASWLPLVVGGVLGVEWMQWGWWLPALSLARDVIAPDERIMT
jgi:hypothetical protein